MASLPHDAKPALLPLAGHPYRFLGSYRFMLALFVLTSHASGFLGDAVARLSLGNVGVFLFFMVSGAVISEALDIFYNGSGRRFLINRSLKIFPAYWAALCLYYAVFAFKGALGSDFQLWPVLVNVSLLLSYLPTGNNLLIISIAWAVVVECQFYLIAAMLYVAAWRTRTPGRVLFVGGIVALGIYLFIHNTGGHARFYGGFRFAPYFVLGSAIYYAFTRNDAKAALLAVVAGALSLHAYLVYALQTPPGGLPPEAASYQPPVLLSTVLFMAGVLLFIWLFPRRFQRQAERLDKRLGDYTYAIYLIHPLIIIIALDLGIAAKAGGGTAYLFTLAISLAVAVAIARGVERPVMRLRNRFRGQRLYD
jgi:peptidoglycan/LPS O-acetylase OafA/YrhL